MRAFGAQWAAMRDGQPTLSRDRFRAEEWGRWWSNMLLYSVEPDPEGKRQRIFRMTYQGDEVEYTDGGSKIGKRIEEIAPAELVARTLAVYDRVATERVPVYSIRVGVWGRIRHVAFERLLLPLGDPSGDATSVLGLILDHGLDDKLKRSDLFAQSPTLNKQSFAICRIDPESFAGLDVEKTGKGIGVPIPQID
ncbi:MAG: hypothetical protein HY059_21885 [Proteobacteria bacterium]|nr:hypothetical protein [Pseudomonadota bacterium]